MVTKEAGGIWAIGVYHALELNLKKKKKTLLN
jgi:hypothetical protein